MDKRRIDCAESIESFVTTTHGYGLLAGTGTGTERRGSETSVGLWRIRIRSTTTGRTIDSDVSIMSDYLVRSLSSLPPSAILWRKSSHGHQDTPNDDVPFQTIQFLILIEDRPIKDSHFL